MSPYKKIKQIKQVASVNNLVELKILLERGLREETLDKCKEQEVEQADFYQKAYEEWLLYLSGEGFDPSLNAWASENLVRAELSASVASNATRSAVRHCDESTEDLREHYSVQTVLEIVEARLFQKAQHIEQERHFNSLEDHSLTLRNRKL